MTRRRLRGVLVGALALAMGTGALLAGAATAGATTGTPTATSGTVTLTARGTGIDDDSPFARVSVDKACPANYQDALTVSLVVPDGRESLLASHLTGGAPYAKAPVTAQVPEASGNGTIVRSIATAFDVASVPVADGTYPIHVTCANADRANFPEHPTFTGFIDVTGDTWQVSSHAAPVATSVRLSADPAHHVQVGKPFTLTAKVAGGVPGAVQFEADNGVTVYDTPVPVVNGVATFQPPANTAPNVRSYIAVFIPADQLAYAQDYSVLSYSFVNAPSVTVTDADGNALGDSPQLTPGQHIKVSAQGFLPQSQEQVLPFVSNALALFAPVATDARGSVTGYDLTVPKLIARGSHTLTLTGLCSFVQVSFTFTTK
ncbi:hypothetical protein ABZX65_11740 [Streptomyces sp. NPDC003300]|uniref:hypothetical protein n=1 Tax=unclassified Streptomyces TaxID=2593676 RepID=UPI0033B03B6F